MSRVPLETPPPPPTTPGRPPLAHYHRRMTPRGILAVTLDWEADPTRDAAWEAAERLAMGDRDFRREHGHDWTTGSGDAFYPEFCARPSFFVRPSPGLIHGPIIRGWDFGWRMPACVWFQVSRSGRVWVLREWMPQQISTHTFVDVVLWLSGQKSRGELDADPDAIAWAERLEVAGRRGIYPPPPWFGFDVLPTRWLDYAGPEALRPSATVEGEHSARTDAQVLASRGVTLSIYQSSPRARGTFMRRLLQARPDGNPGILFDPACPLLIQCFNGGLTFPKKKLGDEPMKDGYFDNIHDALGYGIVNTVPIAEQLARPAQIVYEGRRRVDETDPGEADLMENRRPIQW